MGSPKRTPSSAAQTNGLATRRAVTGGRRTRAETGAAVSRLAVTPWSCVEPTRLSSQGPAVLSLQREIAMTEAATNPGEAPASGAGLVGAAGMWTFLATDAMGFGGLFIAYAALRVRADTWPDPRARLALMPAVAMTFVLLGCSFVVSRAVTAERRGARLAWLGATLALGAAFLAGVVAEYLHLATGARRMGFGADLFASTFYALTGYHALHVLAGVVALLPLMRRRVSRRGLEVLALYWHFVDLAWMPIFTFLYLLPAGQR